MVYIKNEFSFDKFLHSLGLIFKVYQKLGCCWNNCLYIIHHVLLATILMRALNLVRLRFESQNQKKHPKQNQQQNEMITFQSDMKPLKSAEQNWWILLTQCYISFKSFEKSNSNSRC